MASFGESLRQARIARNMTLQEISALTKVGTRALQALEDEKFELLPGGIFNKGFVRSYARCVGLDEEKTLAAYLAAAKIAAPEPDVQAMSTQSGGRMPGRMTGPEPWWGLNAATVVGVFAVIVALGLGALWLREQRKEAKQLAASQHRVESPAASAAAPVSPPPQTVVPSSDPNAASSQTPNQAVIPASGATNPAAGVSSQPVTAASKAEAAQLASTPPAAPVQISISATARAWISVRSDGKTVETLTLDPEKPEMRTRSYTARDKLMLVVGNPAGLSVTYNGKPAGTLGLAGRRTIVTFTPQGIEKQ